MYLINKKLLRNSYFSQAKKNSTDFQKYSV